MRHHLFTPSLTGSYRGALLIKSTSFMKDSLVKKYVQPLSEKGIPDDQLIAFTLTYDDAKKVTNKTMKAYLAELLPELDDLEVEVLYVADSNYFKVLAGQTKAEVHMGYALPCKIKGFEHMTVCLGVNYGALVHNPDLQSKIDLSLGAFAGVLNGTYKVIGDNIIHSAQYPTTYQDIHSALQSLHAYPELTCDIEGFSLRFNECGIATISFAWDEHNGIAFACDYQPMPEGFAPGYYGQSVANKDIRFLLKAFFSSYKGKITWHNGAFDLKPIIYNLWMDSLGDTRGLLTGLDIMHRGFEDTKIVAYLALNSTADYSLGLKALAHEFAGNYAQDDIKDIRRIPLPDLLRYNLVDCLSTWYVKKKLTPKMVQDQQEGLYRGLLLPSQKLLTQMELTGMAMSKAKLEEVETKLQKISQDNLAILKDSPVIKTMNLLVQTKKMEDKNAVLKKKQVTLEDFADELFNPRSGQQLQRLLYECMGLPIIDRTTTGQPGTGNDTLKKLLNHAQQPEYKTLIKAIMGFLEAEKILSTFIPAFKKGLAKADDGIIWLFGSFNIGGTVSGRLSSSDPNLQNVPANSTFGKLIKEIFTGPPGFLFCGADFNALEARIDALTTQDSNKLAIYIEGMDSHAFNTLAYWPEKMPDISKYLTQEYLSEQHYRVEYSDGSVEYLPESLLPC